jgi:predicted permease
MDTFWAVIAGLVPSIGVGLLFWFVMRKIVRADRNERAALEREEDAARGATSESRGN